MRSNIYWVLFLSCPIVYTVMPFEFLKPLYDTTSLRGKSLIAPSYFDLTLSQTLLLTHFNSPLYPMRYKRGLICPRSHK